MADIFLSYSSKDKERVKPLVNALEREGWTVWWDRNTAASDVFDGTIHRELESSRCVVVVWSIDSVKSHWVRDEAETGREMNVLIPVRIDAVTLPLGFKLIQAVDLVGWTGYSTNAEYQHLVQSIEEKIGKGQHKAESVNQDRPVPTRSVEYVPPVEEVRKEDPPRPSSPTIIHNQEVGPETSQIRQTLENMILPIAGWVILVGLIICGFIGGSDEKKNQNSTNEARVGQVVTDDRSGIKERTLRLKLSNRGTLSLQIVDLPGGQFQMGSTEYPYEKPVHAVVVDRFSIGKYEVTQEQWRAVMESNPSRFKGDMRPVETVSWIEAKEFCQILSEMTSFNFRLPTEAEWEYAARAGTRTKWSFGDDEKKLGEYAWFYGNAGGETHPVGQKKPNRFGLYDMHGNVWEWVEDHWQRNYKGAPTDGRAWLTGDNKTGDGNVSRSLRGGAWLNSDDSTRSANRSLNRADKRFNYSGFRVVVEEQTLR